MKLKLKRIALKENYTIGKLYIDGVYFCDTLEDKVRDLNHDGDLNDPGEAKVYGETAIPYGTYKFVLGYSPHFKCMTPRLQNVKHFEGILIHWGNFTKDTLGCILVGKNTIKGQLTESKVTFAKLMACLEESKQKEFYITIE
ncbi:MAG: DUF5675 family protein [Lentimicrobiaceae bacterium]